MRYCDDCGKWCKEQHGLTRPYRTHFETLLTTLTAVLAHPDWASGYGGCGEEDVDDDQEDQDQVRAGDRDPVLYGGACGVRGSRGGRIVSPVILTFVSNLWRAESRIWWRRR